MYFSDALPDLRWLAALPGTKLLIRGNHDYWWPSISKLRAELPKSVYALQNDHFLWEDQVICGTRGWLCPGEEGFDNEHDQKLYEREVQRLHLSLQSAKQAQFSEIIVALHFPPFNRKGQPNALLIYWKSSMSRHACSATFMTAAGIIFFRETVTVLLTVLLLRTELLSPRCR
jgi:uncharacterized protein